MDATIAVFKNDRQREHCLNNPQEILGRLILLAETSAGLLGGKQVEIAAHEAVGHPIKPFEMYPISDMSKVCVVAARFGVSPRYIGRMIYPRMQQADPQNYPSAKVPLAEVADCLDRGRSQYSQKTVGFTYETLPSGIIRAVRQNNPYPCEYVAGLLEGGFKVCGHNVHVAEVACRWLQDGSPCVFEISAH